MTSRRGILLAASAALVLGAAPALGQEKFIVVASTTSTEQSGLFGISCPFSRGRPGSRSRVVALGRVFLSSTRMGGRYVLRICVLSFRTHQDRLHDAVTALREEATALGA